MYCVKKKKKKNQSLADQIIDGRKKSVEDGKKRTGGEKEKRGGCTISRTNAFHDVTRE